MTDSIDSNMGSQSISPILLVEDRASDVDLTKRAFSRQRLLNPVQVARDGEEALAFIDRWEAGEPLPIFILLDLKLPKISGHELLELDWFNNVGVATKPVSHEDIFVLP